MLTDADAAAHAAKEQKAATAAAMRAGVDAGKGDLDFSVIGQR